MASKRQLDDVMDEGLEPVRSSNRTAWGRMKRREWERRRPVQELPQVYPQTPQRTGDREVGMPRKRVTDPEFSRTAPGDPSQYEGRRDDYPQVGIMEQYGRQAGIPPAQYNRLTMPYNALPGISPLHEYMVSPQGPANLPMPTAPEPSGDLLRRLLGL